MSNEKSNEGVGFGRPPKQHQFKKGQSGNPRGAPKKSLRKAKSGEIDIAGILNAEVPIRNSDRQTMSPFEVMCRGLANQGIKGNFRAAIFFFRRCETYKVIRTSPRRKTHGVIIYPPGATKEEIERQYYEEEPPRPKKPRRGNKRLDRMSILQAIAYERHSLVVNGKKWKPTTLELVIEAIKKGAYESKPTAVRMLEELHDRYDAPAVAKAGGFLIVPGMATDIEEFNKEADEQQRQFREPQDYEKLYDAALGRTERDV